MVVGRSSGVTSGRTPKATPTNRFNSLSREGILREVRQLASRLKTVPTPAEIRKHFGLVPNGPIEDLFGSTDRLLNEAKLAYRLCKDRLGRNPS